MWYGCYKHYLLPSSLIFTCGVPNLNLVPKPVDSKRKANVLPLTLKSNFSVYVSIGLVEDLCDDPVEVCVMPEPENVCAFNVKSTLGLILVEPLKLTSGMEQTQQKMSWQLHHHHIQLHGYISTDHQ